jgi:hypothetical protein
MVVSTHLHVFRVRAGHPRPAANSKWNRIQTKWSAWEMVQDILLKVWQEKTMGEKTNRVCGGKLCLINL